MQLRALLLKRDGGDRVMARVLAAVAKAGLEAVLVAVEPGARIGQSQRRACRECAQPPASGRPDSVETHLEVGEEPIADAGRYDSLRTEVSHA